MKQDIRHPLGRFFLIWLVAGNALWWWGPGSLQQVLGDGVIWALVIPLSCIIGLHPRRSVGALLAGLAAGALLLINLADRFAQPARRSQAKLTIRH